MLPGLRRHIGLQYRSLVNELSLFKNVKLWFCLWCCPTSKPSVSAVLFGFHGINLFKNLVSRELLRILENFHFSISISKHFDFTFHFSKKSESILISLCTSRKRVKAFFFHFALLEKEWKLFIFTFHFSNFKNTLSLVPVGE